MFVSCDGGTEDNSELSDVKLNDESEEGKRTRSNASSENNEETEEGKVEFPDTEIKIEHVRGDQ